MTKKVENPKKKPHPIEVKKEAVERVILCNETIYHVAKEMQLSYTTVKRWVEDYRLYGDAVYAKEGTYLIYMHIAPNGKVYVGQTKQNPHTRWHAGTGYKQNVYFSNAIKKYGWDNFIHRVVYSGLSRDDADRLEQETIKKYRANDRRYGYNITIGGNSGDVVSEETRQKLSRIFSGKANPHSERHNRNISKAKGHPVKQFDLGGQFIRTYWSTGVAALALGKKRDQQSHIVDCCNGKRRSAFGFRWCWEEDSGPIDLKGLAYNARRVAQYEIDGTFVAEYESLVEAGRSINKNDRTGDNIQVCCSGRIKLAYGFQWRYVEDDLDYKTNIAPLKGHPKVWQVKQYMETHNKKETAIHYEISYSRFFRYLKKINSGELTDDDYLI